MILSKPLGRGMKHSVLLSSHLDSSNPNQIPCSLYTNIMAIAYFLVYVDGLILTGSGTIFLQKYLRAFAGKFSL